MTRKIEIYDTTLRDGAQSENVAFEVEDKLRIAQHLDELGVAYIEGGWPGSNMKDVEFFRRMKKIRLKHSTLVAFGSTRRKGIAPQEDANLADILKSGVSAAALVGKAWDFHVEQALRTTEAEHLDSIFSSIEFLKKRLDKVVFDAEHFFDGWRSNKTYALKALQAAIDGGADCLCLCDTNGGALPSDVSRIVGEVLKTVKKPVGIHCHNDSGTAVASSIMAVIAGASQVQGTLNGFRERCGNADLCSIIPNLQLKMGMKCIPAGNLKKLQSISRFVYEMANMPTPKNQPFVGESAFAHKGGIHVSAIKRHKKTYEHIEPESVGNRSRVLISEQAGRSNIEAKARQFGLKIDGKEPVAKEILRQVKTLESQGYQFEGAEASFELLMRKAFGKRKRFFDLLGFRVIDEIHPGENKPHAEATIMVAVGKGLAHTAANGNGPVNALDNALRKALEMFYPSLKKVQLLDYKVRVLPTGSGTGSRVRVLIESTDGVDKWGTVGVSENIIEASYEALTDSIDYMLYKDEKKKASQAASVRKKKK